MLYPKGQGKYKENKSEVIGGGEGLGSGYHVK